MMTSDPVAAAIKQLAGLGPFDPDRFEKRLQYVQVDERRPVKRRKRRPRLTTIIRQAMKAGLTVTEIRPDGTLITGKPGETTPTGTSIELDDAAPVDRSDWN